MASSNARVGWEVKPCMTANASENGRIAREYFVAAMNDNEFDESLLTDDYHAQMGSHNVAALDGIKANIGAAHGTFPDLSTGIEDLIASKQDVVLGYRTTGTHQGSFMGIDPTGVEIDQIGFIQFTCEDGMIAKAWNLTDRFALMQRLGVIEA